MSDKNALLALAAKWEAEDGRGSDPLIDSVAAEIDAYHDCAAQLREALAQAPASTRPVSEFVAEWRKDPARAAAIEQVRERKGPRPAADSEAVAEVGPVWSLRWVGVDSLPELLRLHPDLRIGTKLYTRPPAAATVPGAVEILRATYTQIGQSLDKPRLADQFVLVEPVTLLGWSNAVSAVAGKLAAAPTPPAVDEAKGTVSAKEILALRTVFPGAATHDLVDGILAVKQEAALAKQAAQAGE